jgi:hypothetical protein
MSITLVPRGVSDIPCAIDNQGWIWALLQGHPRNADVNRVLRVLYTVIDERRLRFGLGSDASSTGRFSAAIDPFLRIVDVCSRTSPTPILPSPRGTRGGGAVFSN